MKKTVAQRLRQETADHHHRDSLRIMAGGFQRLRIAQDSAIDPFGGEHLRSGADPVQHRHAEIVVIARVVRQFRSGRRFHSQIQFKRDGGGQRINHGLQPQPARFRGEPFGHSGRQTKR